MAGFRSSSPPHHTLLAEVDEDEDEEGEGEEEDGGGDEAEEEEDEELADENAVKRMAITRVASAKSEMTANVHEGGASSSDPSTMPRSRSAPEMPGYLAPDAVAADILRHEPEQETFVRLRINATGGPGGGAGGDNGNGMGF